MAALAEQGAAGEEDAKEEKEGKKNPSPVEIIQRSVEFSSDYFYTGQNLTACTLGEGHARRDGEVPRLRFWQMWSLSFRLSFLFFFSASLASVCFGDRWCFSVHSPFPPLPTSFHSAQTRKRWLKLKYK